VILADTSIWIDLLRGGKPEMQTLLQDGQVVMHPLIVAEVALGSLGNRQQTLALMESKSMSLEIPALGGEQRQKTRAFSELQSYYLFADKFGRPAKGNDKGKVEGLVGYARRNFMMFSPGI